MHKREAVITARLRKYLQSGSMSLGSCAIEMKVTTGKSLPFDAVQEHQLIALQQCRQQFIYKIPDDSRGAKPFDMFVFRNANAFVGVCFIVPRKTPVVYLVPVITWVKLQQDCNRKSATEEMLKTTDGVLTLVLSTTSP